MHLVSLLLAGVLAVLSPVIANSDLYDFGNLPPDHILYGHGGAAANAPSRIKRQAPSSSLTPDPQCTHGPQTRACWTDGYSIATDFDDNWPITQQTKSYDWTITNTTCNPDGKAARQCSLINGQFPGPKIEADWGDIISVTIHNALPDNGTSIHWHGIRQLNTNAMDGTNGLTECPIAPGQSSTYTFQATQFGTSWYHSHHSSQYGDGVLGPIVINGPASANYDLDLGSLPVGDWYYTGAFAQEEIQYDAIQIGKAGPPPDTNLINGTNGANGGSYSITTLTPGKTHRLRLINTAVENPIRVSIDNHQMQVITSDFVPIHPVWIDSVMLGIGQRYDVIVNANQTVDNYWIRATAETACDAFPNQSPALAIVRYDGAPDSNPTSDSTVTSTDCAGPGVLTPWVSNTVGSVDEFKAQARDLELGAYLPGATTNKQNIVYWGINSTAIDVQWNNPILEYVKTGNTSYPVTENVIELPTKDTWVFWIMQETGPVNVWHPMHLHGHDFYILGSGTGVFDVNSDPEKLTYENPTRRDTVQLPANGWLAIAFPTDNPGAWLFHCHITWHSAEGMGIQFLESKDSINIPDSLTDQCNTWQTYYDTAPYLQPESGL